MTGFTRRQALLRLADGVGGIGLAAFLSDQGVLTAQTVAPKGKRPHHAPKAKSLIFLNMMGGPSQFESFTYKPTMDKHAGKTVTVTGAQNAGNNPIMPSAWKFKKSGRSGLDVCEIFPHLATVADDLCVIESMVCDDNNHPGAQREIMTGWRRPMPSFGSWITYGLGSENKDLPGFAYLAEGNHHASGFLPAETQGMPLRAFGKNDGNRIFSWVLAHSFRTL